MKKALEQIRQVQVGTIFKNQFDLSDSFTSLLMGIVFVIIGAILLLSFFKGRHVEAPAPTVQQATLSTKTIAQDFAKVKPIAKPRVDTYTVVEGDTLWSIAEAYYKSGFEYVKIAKANNITNPDIIEKGQKLVVPGVDTRILATSTVADYVRTQIIPNKQPQNQAITADTYKIQREDFLWEIAIRAYGDGYRWVDIAKANNLNNPNLIFADNVLKIPR